MKRVLITGVGGFVGKSIHHHLCRQYDLFELYPTTHKTLDLLNSDSVRTFVDGLDLDVVIHCASVGGTRKTAYDAGKTDVVYQNMRMFHNLVSAVGADCRIIHMGSGAEYSKEYCKPKMNEDYFGVHVPTDPYGFSKYAISRYIDAVDNMTCLRIFGLFGKYDDYRFKFISNSIIKNILKLPITINQNAIFDYLYVEDFLNILDVMLKEKPKYKHMNVTPTQSIDLVSIANIVNEIGGFRGDIKIVHGGMNREFSGDNSRLLEELPGLQFTPYRKSIEDLYKYYSAHMDSIDVAAVRADPYLQYCTHKE